MLRIQEAVDGGFCLLEVMCRVLLYTLEAVESELCVLEVLKVLEALEVLEAIRCLQVVEGGLAFALSKFLVTLRTHPLPR